MKESKFSSGKKKKVRAPTEKHFIITFTFGEKAKRHKSALLEQIQKYIEAEGESVM